MEWIPYIVKEHLIPNGKKVKREKQQSIAFQVTGETSFEMNSLKKSAQKTSSCREVVASELWGSKKEPCPTHKHPVKLFSGKLEIDDQGGTWVLRIKCIRKCSRAASTGTLIRWRISVHGHGWRVSDDTVCTFGHVVLCTLLSYFNLNLCTIYKLELVVERWVLRTRQLSMLVSLNTEYSQILLLHIETTPLHVRCL